jgi:glycosyltransferase involved in cell wall biosynthesis
VRILCVGNMYPPQHLGGYELVWRSAVEHLRARGHAVEVLTTDFRRPGAGSDDPGVPPTDAGVYHGGSSAQSEPGVHRELRWYWRDHAFPRLAVRGRLALERHNHAALARRLDALAPDVVTWWSMGGMSLSLLGAVGRAGLPSVAFVHDDWLLYGPVVDQWTRLFRRAPRPLAAAVARRAGVPVRFEPEHVGRWVFVSEFVRARALGAGWPLRETAVAGSGIDPAFLGPGPGPEREWEWEWRLLCVGRIDARKGIDTAVSALATLPEAATLTVVGEGDAAHLDALRALAARLGLAGRVRLEGARPRAALPAVYDAHDALLFPARWDEPWGLVPLEALARGRPVVATGTGGSAEYLRDGDNCVLIAPDDPAGLAAAVHRLAADPSLRARLRVAGPRTAAQHTEERFNAAVAAAVEAPRPASP